MDSKPTNNNGKSQVKNKRYHKKQLAAITDSMYKYPYQNLSLVNMDMEIWKDIPDYEGYYMVSNKGRIKTLPREIAHYLGKHFINHQTEEKIIKQSIYKTYSKYRDEYVVALIFRATVDNYGRMYRVSRAVYEAFIEPIPKGMLVLHKGDPLDNSVENLYLATHKELARIKQDQNRNAINKKGGLFAEKEVSQYDLDGNYIATFRSISQASEITGADAPGITEAVNGKRITAKGYFWRKGHDQIKLDTAAIHQKAAEKRAAAYKIHRRQIVQFSLDGEYMETYDSIKTAAEKTGLPREAISDVLRGKRYLSREYIWKYADSFEDNKIPSQIVVEAYKLPEPVQTTNQRKIEKLTPYDYPYQDLIIFDMEGEVWKEVPTLETYCMVSNLGRIKTIPRFVDRPTNGRRLINERIIKQEVRTLKQNKRTGKYNQCLYFSIGIEGKLHQMAVSRAVYAAFVSPLANFKEDKVFVLHKDLDIFNNQVENLYIATRQQMAKRNVREGMMAPPDVSKFTDELWQKIKKIHSKPVSQYMRNGKYIATFPSISEACRVTGASKGGIARVAQETEKHAGGFIWRFGSDTKDLDKATLQKYKPKKHFRARTINQYDLNGNFLRTFESITEIANKLGYSRRNLNHHILKETPDFEGYIWRPENDTFPISPEILAKYKNGFSDRRKSVKQYTKQGEYITTYPSIEETARNIGCSSRLINMAVHGKVKTAKGFIFRLE